MNILACRNNILIEELQETSGFSIPHESNDGLRFGKVISVGDFVYHICGEKIYPECKVGDIVGFVFNGNEKFNKNGKTYYLEIFDQLRCIVK